MCFKFNMLEESLKSKRHWRFFLSLTAKHQLVRHWHNLGETSYLSFRRKQSDPYFREEANRQWKIVNLSHYKQQIMWWLVFQPSVNTCSCLIPCNKFSELTLKCCRKFFLAYAKTNIVYLLWSESNIKMIISFRLIIMNYVYVWLTFEIYCNFPVRRENGNTFII